MTCISSGLKTSSALIATGKSVLHGVLIVTDGTNPATAIVYDGLSATGTELFKGVIAGADCFGGATFEHPVEAFTGIYVAVSGTSAACIAYYKAG